MSTSFFLTACTNCQKKIKLTDRTCIGKNAKCPGCQQKFKIAEFLPVSKSEMQAPEKSPVNQTAKLPESAPAIKVLVSPDAEPVFPDLTKPRDVPYSEFDFSQIATPETALPGKLRKKSSPVLSIMLGISSLMILGGGVWYMLALLNKKTEIKPKPKLIAGEEYKQLVKEKVDQFKLVRELDPTQGDPLNLKLLPAGIRVAIHLRLGLIFSDDPNWQEFRASLGPLAEWLKTNIEQVSHFQIDQIDRILVGLILGARGTPPEIACVVQLKKPVALSEVLINFQVAPLSKFGTDVYGNEKFAFVMVNSQTFAFCPPALIEDVVNFRQHNTISTDGITALLTSEKEESHVAVVFENDDLYQQIPYLFPSTMLPLLNRLSDWFGKDAETTLCSFQLQEPFYAELIVRNKPAAKPISLERTLIKNLRDLPQEVLAVTRLMKPQQMGYQQLIGRLPAMLKVLSICTTSCTDKQAVHLVTVMPLKAAPNLAAASILAWDESTRTNFLLASNNNSTIPAKDAPKKNLPDSMAERMKVKIDVEFNRVPLQDAFAFIGNEIEVKVEIDGDALKAGGYTKNMPQSFLMKQTSVADICHKIVGQYNQTEIMCIAVDEKTKTIFVLTESVAKSKGLTVYK